MAITRNVHIKEMDGEEFKLVIQTEHQTPAGLVWANTAVHDQVFARRIGGVRFVVEPLPGPSPEDLTEVGELAEAMTWKSPLSGLPADGEKTLVYCPSGLPTPDQMAEILLAHLKEATAVDPGITFGPDINCNEVVMQKVADSGMGGHVSGLLHGKGGLSIDGQGYTARGLEAAIAAAASRLNWDLPQMKAVIQGFGAVGAHTARNLNKHGVRVHAVSTVHGSLVAETEEGLNVDELFADWDVCRRAGRPSDAFKRFLHITPKKARWADKNHIWTESADIFVPAARTDVLAMPDEIPHLQEAGQIDVVDVTYFAKATGVRVVVEGANHPVTDAAEAYLEDQGIFVLPDYLVNCGGLIGCWADWVYRDELQGSDSESWYHRLTVSVQNYIGIIVSSNMLNLFDITGNQPIGMRRATHELARKRREDLAADYRAFCRSTGELDGRKFARSCLDALLEENF